MRADVIAEADCWIRLRSMGDCRSCKALSNDDRRLAKREVISFRRQCKNPNIRFPLDLSLGGRRSEVLTQIKSYTWQGVS